ncbi:hypothetical protein [Haliangium sp.]|uniref:hypothetical protein n=1 Tax=Haliangium sp. TaxID=2663208 RepID=UPI003D09911D
MLDSFEAKLADLLADRVADVAVIDEVRRPQIGGSQPSATQARVTVEIISTAPVIELGDDKPEVLGQAGAFSLRTVMHLTGGVLISLELASTSGTGAATQRDTLLMALDSVLLALHDPEVRNGRAFGDADDQGFALSAFRLEQIAPSRCELATGEDPERHHIYCRYGFTGRFWPVETPPAGDVITTIPTRIALLPAEYPETLRALAGGPDLTVPVRLDLRALNGATPRLFARLMGASPPGQLIGDSIDVPEGSVAYDPDPPGTYAVVYRPPASLDGVARVRVRLALARAEGPPVTVETLAIEVQGA